MFVQPTASELLAFTGAAVSDMVATGPAAIHVSVSPVPQVCLPHTCSASYTLSLYWFLRTVRTCFYLRTFAYAGPAAGKTFPLALLVVDSWSFRIQVRGHLLREFSFPVTTHPKECPVPVTVTLLAFTFFFHGPSPSYFNPIH